MVLVKKTEQAKRIHNTYMETGFIHSCFVISTINDSLNFHLQQMIIKTTVCHYRMSSIFLLNILRKFLLNLTCMGQNFETVNI